MKDEKAWDYSQCQIGHPCKKCDDVCSFRKITFRLDKGADEKENDNYEQTTGYPQGTVQCNSHR